MTKSTNASLQPNPNGDMPQVHPTAYIHPTAQLIGNVHIGPKVYIGPNAVIRSDEQDAAGKVAPIEIAEESNVQDGVIIHALAGTKVIIGKRTSLTHGAIIHGPCKIGNDCFIGFRAVIYQAELKDGTFISTAAIVQQVNLPKNSFVPPAATILSDNNLQNLTTTTPDHREFMKKIVTTNIALTQGYSRPNQPKYQIKSINTKKTIKNQRPSPL